jgi:hypothetical protein
MLGLAVERCAMFTVEESGRIAGQRVEVFDYFSDLRNEQRWNPDVRTVRLTTPEPIREGSVFTEKVRGVGAMEVRHTLFDRPYRLDLIADSRRMTVRFRFDFADLGRETGFRAHAEVEPWGAMGLIEPVLRPVFVRTFRRRPAQIAKGLAASRSTR